MEERGKPLIFILNCWLLPVGRTRHMRGDSEFIDSVMEVKPNKETLSPVLKRIEPSIEFCMKSHSQMKGLMVLLNLWTRKSTKVSWLYLLKCCRGYRVK